MSEVVETPVVESPEAELPLAEFVKRGNARDAGKDVPELAAEPEPETPAPVAAETEEEPAEPKIAASTGKPDKRTREGRLATIQAQIDAETARKHAAKAEADAEEQRLATLRAEAAKLNTPRPQAAQPPPQASQAQGPTTAADYKRFMAMPDAPKMNDFTGENAFEEWQFAVNAFVADKRFDERMARQREQDARAAQGKAFSDSLNAVIAKRPGLQEKIAAGQIDSRVMPHVMGHPMGAEIFAYLAENPEVTQQLSMLNPHPVPHANAAQIGQIGEIAGMLKARADAVSRGPARAQVSQAKPPIKPLGSSPTVSDDDDGEADENLPLAEFVRRGNRKDPARTLRAVRR